MDQTHKPSIGDELPYRRSAMEGRTGSLVFDQHREQTAGAEAAKTSPESVVDEDDLPVDPGQVT